uniref:IGF-like family receptor 1 n=1 Tax=Oreochromis aureus TaxID=47969 RepID=A0AAZ1X8H4_OREAU
MDSWLRSFFLISNSQNIHSVFIPDSGISRTYLDTNLTTIISTQCDTLGSTISHFNFHSDCCHVLCVWSQTEKSKGFLQATITHKWWIRPLTGSSNGSDVEDILSPDILSAPLQTVLDNLDVLEELVILLDPESHVRKSTKHLASHCAFPSTWITYTYSMKDTKSPLKAVLEGVTCKNPDWTVGHLAKLLKHMERNDAIAALAKLKINKTEV